MANQELGKKDDFPRDRSTGEPGNRSGNQPEKIQNPGRMNDPARGHEEPEDSGRRRGQPGPERQSDDRE
jgi:hypothetical protein